MKRPRLLLVAVVLLLIVCTPELRSHGGRFSGKQGSTGPNAFAPPTGGGGSGGSGGDPRPGDLVPPNRTGNSGGAARSAPAPKHATGPSGGAPETPGAAVPATGGRGRGAATGGSRAQAADDGGDQWEQWWELNKEPLLALKHRLQRAHTESPDSSSRPATEPRPERASRNAVHQRILPALIEALGETDADIVDSATLAIGRSAGGEDRDRAYLAIRAQLGNSNQSVREAATLSLGLLGDLRAVATLSDLARDTPHARMVLSLANGTPNRVRAFAAIALGLLGVDEVRPTLVWAIENEPGTQRDLKSCAVVALGLLAKKDEALVSYLIKLIDDRDVDRTVRAHIPAVIARCESLGVAAVPALFAIMNRDTTDRDLQRSVVIALGKLASLEQTAVIEALRRVALTDRDPGARNFAWIALAEIGARDGDAGVRDDDHRRLAQLLMEGVQHPNVKTLQPWASLALALYARAHDSVRAAAVQCLRETFPRVENPSTRSALAVSLGLLDASEAAPMLMKEMLEASVPELRGYVALSLGLMGQTAAAPLLRHEIRNPGLDWRFRMNLARGLGLMADVQAIPDLISALGSARGLADAASLAQALGLIGDDAAIEPLTSLLADHQKSGMQRGFAAVALGLLGEEGVLPWHSSITTGLNYRARTPALEELFDIL